MAKDMSKILNIDFYVLIVNNVGRMEIIGPHICTPLQPYQEPNSKTSGELG